MSHSLGIAIESLVAVLLMLTIGYCALLNARLKRLKADEHSLKATIGELITATEIAERAIGGLKHTVRDVNVNLGEQLDRRGPAVAAVEEATRGRRQCPAAAVQDRDRRAARGRAGARGAAGFGGQGDCRGGAGVLRTQKVQWPRRMKSFRDIRIIPVVLVAIFGFAVLKVAGLVIDGGYVFDYDPQSTKQSWAQETFNFPAGTRADAADITGSVDEKKEGKGKKSQERRRKTKPRRKRPSRPPRRRSGEAEEGALSGAGPAGIAVRARHPRAAAVAAAGTGSARPRNRHSRKPAQGRRKARRNQGPGIEGDRIPGSPTATEQKTEADAAHFKGIITMYESMKPKDAAKVFDRLEMPVLYRNRLADRAAQDVRHPRPDVDRSGRAADHRNGPPRQLRQIRLRRRSSQNRRQDAAAKAQLSGIFNKSLNRQF